MVRIWFETHATTVDNEAGVASGERDVALSARGIQEAEELGRRNRGRSIAVVFCSDLQRSWRTAEIAFAGGTVPIVRDGRLRECRYGDLAGRPRVEIEAVKGRYIQEPFPNGESLAQAAGRVGNFLEDRAAEWDGRTVLIIGHRATQYGLEHWVAGRPLEEVVRAEWRWQPGWVYDYFPERRQR